MERPVAWAEPLFLRRHSCWQSKASTSRIATALRRGRVSDAKPLFECYTGSVERSQFLERGVQASVLASGFRLNIDTSILAPRCRDRDGEVPIIR